MNFAKRSRNSVQPSRRHRPSQPGRENDSPGAHRRSAMIGITFALPNESSDLRRQLRDIQRDDNLVFGRIDNQPVAILHTGVGD